MVKAKTVVWYNQRQYAAILSVALLLLAYLMGSRALDTGSLQQYSLTFILLGFGVNRIIKTIRG